jgi:nitroreductase
MNTSRTPEDVPTLARWAAAARVRRSRRAYEPQPIAGVEAEHLETFCRDYAPFDGARTVVLAQAPPKIFTGLVLGFYGKVTSPSALIFVGDHRLPDAAARAGYTAEAAVLEATALGLGTCWIGGGVRRAHVTSLLSLGAHEHVYSISALGHALEQATLGERATAGMVRARTRKPLDAIAPGCTAWPAWARAGVELARIAPSATNRQPWRFAHTDDDNVRLFFEGSDTPVISKRLDCGIAMLHFELGAREAGAAGSWELLSGRDVARWVPDAGGVAATPPPR